MKMRLLLLALLVPALLAVPARADLYSFYGITNNNANDTAVGEAQLFVDVTNPGAGQVSFRFFNIGPADSSICDVYFDDGPLLGIATINNGTDVSFSQGANPRNLPGGNSVSPTFAATAGFSADSDPPVQPNGVNPGEQLQITFDLKPNRTFTDVLDDLGTADLRIGIHVQGFTADTSGLQILSLTNGGDDDGSESFINNTQAVPVPGAVLLGLLGLGAAGLWLRRAV